MALAVGAEIMLPDAARAHVRARRLREGDTVVLFDGSGQEYGAALVTIDRRDVCVRIESCAYGLGFAAPELTLGLSVIAADRMDWAIQKVCELGVARIVPILAERSQAPGNAANKLPHWQAVAAAAAEQCGRARVATISSPMRVQEALNLGRYLPEDTHIAPQVWMCERAEPDPSVADSARENIVFIGPEGGWAQSELAMFESEKARTLVLSRATLRTETAAVAAALLLLSVR